MSRSSAYRHAATTAFLALAVFGVFAFHGWALLFGGLFFAAAAWHEFARRQFDG